VKRLGNLAGPRVLVSRGLCRVGGWEANAAVRQRFHEPRRPLAPYVTNLLHDTCQLWSI